MRIGCGQPDHRIGHRSLVTIRPTVLLGQGNRGNLYQPLRRDRPMAIRVVMGATVTPEVDGLVGNVSRSWCTPLGLGATGPPCKHADKPQLSIGRAHGPRSADPQPTGVSAVDITLRAPRASGHVHT